ncbi:hypothetical protein BDZ97DRAFT_1924107 [Flammula alnicola]|nr:hypothetical protein BDZ97DRAFT_1924107 [Flammula alnicola]
MTSLDEDRYYLLRLTAVVMYERFKPDPPYTTWAEYSQLGKEAIGLVRMAHTAIASIMAFMTEHPNEWAMDPSVTAFRQSVSLLYDTIPTNRRGASRREWYMPPPADGLGWDSPTCYNPDVHFIWNGPESTSTTPAVETMVRNELLVTLALR